MASFTVVDLLRRRDGMAKKLDVVMVQKLIAHRISPDEDPFSLDEEDEEELELLGARFEEPIALPTGSRRKQRMVAQLRAAIQRRHRAELARQGGAGMSSGSGGGGSGRSGSSAAAAQSQAARGAGSSSSGGVSGSLLKALVQHAQPRHTSLDVTYVDGLIGRKASFHEVMSRELKQLNDLELEDLAGRCSGQVEIPEAGRKKRTKMLLRVNTRLRKLYDQRSAARTGEGGGGSSSGGRAGSGGRRGSSDEGGTGTCTGGGSSTARSGTAVMPSSRSGGARPGWRRPEPTTEAGARAAAAEQRGGNCGDRRAGGLEGAREASPQQQPHASSGPSAAACKRHGRGGFDVAADSRQQRRVARGRPDARFDELVESLSTTHYFDLELLAKHAGLDAGRLPSRSHLRRLLTEANNGTLDAVIEFDYEAFAVARAERLGQYHAEQAETHRRQRKAQAEQAVRDNRITALSQAVKTIRLEHANARLYTHEDGYSYTTGHITKVQCLEELRRHRQDGAGNWDSRNKSKGVPVTLAEIDHPSVWLSGITNMPQLRGGFIDASKLYGTKLLWERVPVLEPLPQVPDERKRFVYRTNEHSVVKLRRAKGCVLESALFATSSLRST